MASCSSLKHVPLPDHHHHHPTLWRKVRSVDDSAFAEILNELNIKGSHESSPFSSPFFNSSRTSSLSSTSSFSTNFPKRVENETPTIQKSLSVSNKRHTNSFSSMSSESLSMCTEDLGFESSDTFEDLLLNETSNDLQNRKKHTRHNSIDGHRFETRKSTVRRDLPPPISSIGTSGRPWVSFKSFKQDGRFILKEIRIPTQDFMQASRENGRLKLHFIHSESEDDDEDDRSTVDKIEDLQEKDCVDDTSDVNGNGEDERNQE